MVPSGEQFTIRHGPQVAVATEVGAGLRRYALGDWEVLDGYAEQEMCDSGRGAALLPWPNRLRDGRYQFGGVTHQLPLDEPERGNAIHGLTRWLRWRVVERAPSRVALALDLLPRPGYPVFLSLRVEFMLDDGGLRTTTTARNTGPGPLPYGAGHHPYLAVGTTAIDEAVLRLPAARYLETDARQLPTERALPVEGTPFDFRRPRAIGPLRLDTAYTALAADPDGCVRAEVAAPDGARSVLLWMDAGHSYLMAYTGDDIEDPERCRRSLALEPMTCAPDAFNNSLGLRVLQPGEAFTSTWGLAPRRR